MKLIYPGDEGGMICVENEDGLTCVKGEVTLMLEPLLSAQAIKAIMDVIAKGDRVELIPVKDGVKVIHIKREEIKP